jgi:hypothetical protein
MKFMFVYDEHHKYVKAVVSLEESHSCTTNWKQGMITPLSLLWAVDFLISRLNVLFSKSAFFQEVTCTCTY